MSEKEKAETRQMPRHATRPEAPGEPAPPLPPKKQRPVSIGGSHTIERQQRRPAAKKSKE